MSDDVVIIDRNELKFAVLGIIRYARFDNEVNMGELWESFQRDLERLELEVKVKYV